MRPEDAVEHTVGRKGDTVISRFRHANTGIRAVAISSLGTYEEAKLTALRYLHANLQASTHAA